MSDEQTVREAALALQNAIADAVAAGYRVEWPGNAAGLNTIAISETAKVVPAEPAVMRPQNVAPAPKSSGEV